MTQIERYDAAAALVVEILGEGHKGDGGDADVPTVLGFAKRICALTERKRGEKTTTRTRKAKTSDAAPTS